MSGASAGHRGKWVYGLRVIPSVIRRARWRNTLTYRALPNGTIGIEYNPLADDVHPLANILVVTETDRRPALILGTSSDRIGTPDGQSYYATLSKNLIRETTLPIAPYFGVVYGTWDDKARPIGGISVFLGDRLSLTGVYDGVRAHALADYLVGRHTFSLVLVRGQDIGIGYSTSF